jgi:hypothetical protein
LSSQVGGNYLKTQEKCGNAQLRYISLVWFAGLSLRLVPSPSDETCVRSHPRWFRPGSQIRFDLFQCQAAVNPAKCPKWSISHQLTLLHRWGNLSRVYLDRGDLSSTRRSGLDLTRRTHRWCEVSPALDLLESVLVSTRLFLGRTPLWPVRS